MIVIRLYDYSYIWFCLELYCSVFILKSIALLPLWLRQIVYSSSRLPSIWALNRFWIRKETQNRKQQTKNKHETETLEDASRRVILGGVAELFRYSWFFAECFFLFSEQARPMWCVLFGTFFEKKTSKTLHSSINLRILWPTSISGGYHLTQVPFLLVIALLRPSVVLLHIPVLAHMPWSNYIILYYITLYYIIYYICYIILYIICIYGMVISHESVLPLWDDHTVARRQRCSLLARRNLRRRHGVTVGTVVASGTVGFVTCPPY